VRLAKRAAQVYLVHRAVMVFLVRRDKMVRRAPVGCRAILVQRVPA
jgi:hypothetical protein